MAFFVGPRRHLAVVPAHSMVFDSLERFPMVFDVADFGFVKGMSGIGLRVVIILVVEYCRP